MSIKLSLEDDFRTNILIYPGSYQSIFLFHGTPLSFLVMDDLAKYLHQISRMTVILYDLRGHGVAYDQKLKEARNEDEANSSLLSQVDDFNQVKSRVSQFLEIPILKYHLIGWSYGGLICQTIALSFPDQILSLTLIGTIGINRDVSQIIFQLKEYLDIIQGIPELLPTLPQNIVDDDLKRWFDFQFINSYQYLLSKNICQSALVENYIASMSYVNFFNLSRFWRDQRYSVLLISSNKDEIATTSAMLNLFQSIRNSRRSLSKDEVKIVQVNGKHGFCIEYPLETAQIIYDQVLNKF